MTLAAAAGLVLGLSLIAIGWRGLALRPVVRATAGKMKGLEALNPELWGAWVFRTPEVDEVLPTLEPEQRRQVEELRRQFEREEAEGRDGASLMDAVTGFRALQRFTRLAPLLVGAGVVILAGDLVAVVA